MSDKKAMRLPAFAVRVNRDASALDPSPYDYDVKSQNVVHAAACALSLAGGGRADLIEVRVLNHRPGKPKLVTFMQCSQDVCGFRYTSRFSS